MSERSGAIKFKGNPMTLVGNEVKVGDTAPNFTTVGNDLKPVNLSDYKGKPVVLLSVPSLDTSVCSTETKRFNDEAGKLGDKAVVLTVSMDLPFAQKRWCGAEDAKNVVTVSDYKDRQFGQKWGLHIKELGLLARAVYVIDAQGVVKHAQLVPEVTQEPDYDAALGAVKSLV